MRKLNYEVSRNILNFDRIDISCNEFTAQLIKDALEILDPDAIDCAILAEDLAVDLEAVIATTL